MGTVLGTPISTNDSMRYTVFAEGNKVFQIEVIKNEFGVPLVMVPTIAPSSTL